ncbi:MAG TPA: hypothetical protein VN706_12775 [Gemmatimonadaceae bacterium]|nr:hypothetical protein [Gemmatimonadaceae bacterium]
MRASNRPGLALVEVLIAIVVLASAGTGLITLLGQTAKSIATTRASERSIDRASALLERLVVWDGPMLVAHEGPSNVDSLVLTVTPVGRALFDVSVAGSDATPPLLRTTLYRPDTTHAP